MVSTRNTSRSYANPLRMQDQQDDVDSQPPGGTLETIRDNTNEMEALRLTNQCLLRELEQLTRQMQRPQEVRQAQEGHNTTPRKSNNTSTPLEKQTGKENPVEPGGMSPTYPSERIAMKECPMGTSEMMSQPLISKGWGSDHGSRGSGASSKSLAI